jgi:hypothetical protein
MLSESVYGRAWHTARQATLGPTLATTLLARRPYDLRHAALSLWLAATGAPAEVAARAGNSVTVPHTVYTHRLHGQQCSWVHYAPPQASAFCCLIRSNPASGHLAGQGVSVQGRAGAGSRSRYPEPLLLRPFTGLRR